MEELGPRFRAVVETAKTYSIAEQFAIPVDLRREAVELFHAPHYVLPPLTPCRAVVTIHDCIHLRFPQYLPSKLGYAYARADVDGDAPGRPRDHGLGGVQARHPALLPRPGFAD